MLDKDDFFEIEKTLDIYSGWLNDTIHKYCQTATNYDAYKEKNQVNPMDRQIKDLIDARDRIKNIRNKLSLMRESGY